MNIYISEKLSSRETSRQQTHHKIKEKRCKHDSNEGDQAHTTQQ